MGLGPKVSFGGTRDLLFVICYSFKDINEDFLKLFTF
jgi:hypothetical protein